MLEDICNIFTLQAVIDSFMRTLAVCPFILLESEHSPQVSEVGERGSSPIASKKDNERSRPQGRNEETCVPTLTAPAAAIPNIDSKNAGVLGHKMPTRLNPCFFK